MNVNVFELQQVACEFKRTADFLKRVGVHSNLWQKQLEECEMAAVQKVISNNRQMVIDFNQGLATDIAGRWGVSRRQAFRLRDKAAKECQTA